MSIDLVVENAISTPQVVQDQHGNRSALTIGSTNVQINANVPIVLRVSGNPGTAPLIEVAAQSNEAAIRYVNNDGLGWHVGSGTGAKTFFFWNHENGVVMSLAADGTLSIGGELKARTARLHGVPDAPPNPLGLATLMIDPATGELFKLHTFFAERHED